MPVQAAAAATTAAAAAALKAPPLSAGKGKSTPVVASPAVVTAGAGTDQTVGEQATSPFALAVQTATSNQTALQAQVAAVVKALGRSPTSPATSVTSDTCISPVSVAELNAWMISTKKECQESAVEAAKQIENQGLVKVQENIINGHVSEIAALKARILALERDLESKTTKLVEETCVTRRRCPRHT